MSKSTVKLYLHCGYHKTGSSFLQTLFAINRDVLLGMGIHFPASVREFDMVSGNISPGNAPELASFLKNGDEVSSRKFLSDRIEEAEKNGCNSLLLSSEALFHTFAVGGSLESLSKISKALGIDTINALVYFRDPVSHAISTYKHRAKNGNIGEFADWVDNDYETMSLLEKFIQYRSEYPVEWTCRKYTADSAYMARSAFVEWLDVSMPDIPPKDEVNASLTFSEIQTIRSLKGKYPKVVEYLKQEFKQVSVNDKGIDKHLIAAHKSIAASRLQSYRSLISEVNRFLRDGEKLELPESNIQNFEFDSSEIVINEKQLLAISKALNSAFKSEQLRGRLREFSEKVSKKIDKLLIRI